MAKIDDIIDSQSEMLEKAWTQTLRKLAQEMTRALDAGIDPLALVEQLDVEKWLLDNGMAQAIASVDYPVILENLRGFGSPTDAQLQALVNIDQTTFLSEIKGQAGTIKAELLNLSIQRLSEAEFSNVLLNTSGIRPDQVKTLANTILNTFSRGVTEVMARTMPANTKYYYQGPNDGKTRDICLAQIAAGELTKDEVDRQFPGAFRTGGGYNCRHRWTEVTKPQENATATKQARADIFVRDQQGEWKTPETPLETKLNA